ncbi:oxidoreductase [Aureococcus anophagefferens]|nr:oxidoreductase [Aureococcus anophagefferens]
MAEDASDGGPMRQDIEFAGNTSLGISVHRVNDPESPAIKKARYGVIHWRVVGVNGAAVVDKAALVHALQAAPPGPVRLTFEAPPDEGPITSPSMMKRQLDAASGDELLKRLKGTLNSKDGARADDVARRACAAHTVVGIRTFDCGDIYAGVEELVGRFLATARGQSRALADSVRLHTKVVPDDEALVARQRCGGEAESADDARRRELALERCVEASVWRSANRLGVGRLDLVYLHWWDWSKEGFVGAVRALEAMKARGVVKDVGLTNVDVSRLRPLLEEEDGPEIACVQVNLSVIDHRPSSSGLCALCAAHGVRLLAHGSLAGGLLSDDWLGRDPPDYASLGPGVASNRVLVDEFGGWDRFQRVLRCLRAVADRHAAAPGPLTKVTVAMVAVAWTLKQTGVSAVVLGARNADHVKDAALAASSLDLSDGDLADVAAALGGAGVTGEVYDLERDARTDFYRLAGSGRMGSRDAPADRNSSRAASESQLVECARRLGQLHACYASSFPDPPDGVFDDASDDNGSKRARGAAGAAAAPAPGPGQWTSTSAYSNLASTQLRDVLRGFVSEIDCLPQDHSGGSRPEFGAPARRVAALRTFAARMLASAEQAVFVEMRNKRQGGAARAAAVRMPARARARRRRRRRRAAAAAAATTTTTLLLLLLLLLKVMEVIVVHLWPTAGDLDHALGDF